MLTSPIYNKNGNIIFENNRVSAHHIGISGQPGKEIRYRIFLSHSRNWETYGDPFVDIRKNTSALLEVNYSPRQLKGWQFSGSVALDHGDMLGNSAGGMITVRKTGLLTK